MLVFLEMDSPVKVQILQRENIVTCNDVFYMADVNECLANPCDVNAVCQNILGSFTCTCNAGFTGDGFSCESELAMIIEHTRTQILLMQL